MSSLGKTALIAEVVICFGCLAVSLLVSAPLLFAYLPLMFSGLAILLGPLLACYLGGILGLYGLYALLRKVLNPGAIVASAGTIVFCAMAGLAAVAGLIAFTIVVVEGPLADGLVLAMALPAVGTLHLMYLGRWYLAPGRFPAPDPDVPLAGHSAMRSLRHVGLLVAITGLLPLLLLAGAVGSLWLLVDEDTLAEIRACSRAGAGGHAVAALELDVPPERWPELGPSLAVLADRDGYEFVDRSSHDADAQLVDIRVCNGDAVAEAYDMHFPFADDPAPEEAPVLWMYIYERSPDSDWIAFARELARVLSDQWSQPVEVQRLDSRGLPIGPFPREPSSPSGDNGPRIGL